MSTFVGFVEDLRWTGISTVNYKSNWLPFVLLPTSPLLNNLILMILFVLQHSIMARQTVREFIGKLLRVQDSLYPSIYALTASLSLLALSQCWIPMTAWNIWSLSGTYSHIAQAISLMCWLLAGAAVMSIDRFQLCGGEQFVEFIFGKSIINKWLPKPEGLITTGLYSIVRHPAMLFMILGIWVGPIMTIGHFFLSIFLTVYIVYAVHYFEEPQLKATFGETYKQYMKNVPYQVLPGIK